MSRLINSFKIQNKFLILAVAIIKVAPHSPSYRNLVAFSHLYNPPSPHFFMNKKKTLLLPNSK